MVSLVASTLAYDKDALAGWFLGLKPEKVAYAINCGSIDSLTDAVGVTYLPVNHQNDVLGRELRGWCDFRRWSVPLVDFAQF